MIDRILVVAIIFSPTIVFYCCTQRVHISPIFQPKLFSIENLTFVHSSEMEYNSARS